MVQHLASSTDVVVWPPYEDVPVRIRLVNGMVVGVMSGDEDRVIEIGSTVIYPSRHHVTPEEELKRACKDIEEEMESRIKDLEEEGNSVAARRYISCFKFTGLDSESAFTFFAALMLRIISPFQPRSTLCSCS